MYAKRYAAIFAVCLLFANVYTFWPAFAYGNTAINCPSIFGQLSINVSGGKEIVGSPLYSETQVVTQPNSILYATFTYSSEPNNLSQLLKPPFNPPLWRINPFSGVYNGVPTAASGVSVSFQNITFQGEHVARVLYQINVSKSASGTYELGEWPCWTGILLTVGYFPYFGPIPYGVVQLMGIIIDNIIALLVAVLACVMLRFYWQKSSRNPKVVARTV